MNTTVATSKFGQSFPLTTAKILSFVKIEADKDGQLLETPFIAMQLSNGEGLNVGINAVARALSAAVRWEHLKMLRGAEVTYATGTRVIGEMFTWRPSDNIQVEATSAGTYHSLLGIEVASKYDELLDSLPTYVPKANVVTPDNPQDNDSANDNEEANADDTQAPPTGSRRTRANQ